MNEDMKKPANRNSRTAWTVEEVRFVEENYGFLSAAEIGGHLGRTRASVKSMANRLGCCAEYNLWSDAELDVLRTDYAAGADMDTVLAMLPRRRRPGIMTKVNALGIFRRRWRADENRILQKYYVSEGTRVARRLPGRTVSAITNQAYTLGLRRPRGRKWSEEEMELLKQNQHLALSELQRLFTGRSKQAVCHARMKLKGL
jgi:hypothetical protein